SPSPRLSTLPLPAPFPFPRRPHPAVVALPYPGPRHPALGEIELGGLNPGAARATESGLRYGFPTQPTLRGTSRPRVEAAQLDLRSEEHTAELQSPTHLLCP